MNTHPPSGVYRHFKGGLYEVLGVARHSETEEEMVVYRPLKEGAGWWVRPLAMFNAMVVVQGAPTPRFEKIAADLAAFRLSSHPLDPQPWAE